MNTRTYTYQSRGSFWGIILILVGLAVLGDNLNWFSFDIWEIFWPAVLIFLGVRMVLRHNQRVVIQDSSTTPPPPNDAPRANYTVGSGAEVINESHLFGEVDLLIDSQTFRGGNVSTVFGEVRIDCAHAALAEGEHTLAVNTVFGEVRIYVPAGMEYSVEGTTVFGEVEAGGAKRGGVFSNVSFATVNFSSSTNKLRIVASTVFGEVRVVVR